MSGLYPQTKLPGQPRPPRKETTNGSISSYAHDGRQPVLLILESIPRQGSRSVSDIRRQADFDVLCITCRLSSGRASPSFRLWFRSNPQILIPAVQGQLLNNAPPVPSAFIGAPVSPQVPPRGRELVPTLDRDYCDHTRHLLTCRASRMALASDFCPGEIPKSLGLLTRRLPDLTTRTLQVLAMACPISTSHPPCPFGHGCFRRLSYSPTSRACAPECHDSKISPESLVPSRMTLTPSVVVLVQPLRAAPEQDWLPAFIIGQGDSGRPETRFRVAQSRPWQPGIGSNPGW